MERHGTHRWPRLPEPGLLAAIRHTRFALGLRCPRCGNRSVHRWGFSPGGRQRYRCIRGPDRRGRPRELNREAVRLGAPSGNGGATRMPACGRTFSDLTGTPAAYIKKLGLWPAYAHHVVTGSTIRASAADLCVDPATTFRWRHRLLEELAHRDRDRVRGWIELDCIRFPESFKGQRGGLGRPPRRRRLVGWDRLRSRRTTVAVAVERRTGDPVTAVVPGAERERPTVAALRRVLERRIVNPPRPQIIVRRGRFSPWVRFVEEVGGRLHDARCGPGSLDLHLHGVDEYGRRLRQWLRRFRGVATRYLPNYLIWHRRWERRFGRGLPENLLRWPVQIPTP